MKPGRELDALIAEKVMGLVIHHKRRDEWNDGDSLFYVYYVEDEEHIEHVPKYSTDISAAWEVVKKLRDLGYRPILMPDWGEDWECQIYREAERIVDSPWCETAPHAICLAALKTHREEQAGC
jgi:hypothetical protein